MEDHPAHRHAAAVARLMADYQPSYDPADAEDEWRRAPGGDHDPYGGPFYRTSAEASEAADRHRERAGQAYAVLPAARAAEQTAATHLDRLHRELAGTWPWQRGRRAKLHHRIAIGERALEDRHDTVDRLESAAPLAEQRYHDAVWIAGVLRRREHAQQAAHQAASRAASGPPGRPRPAPQPSGPAMPPLSPPVPAALPHPTRTAQARHG